MIRGHKRVTVSASIFTMRIKNLLKKIFSFPCSSRKNFININAYKFNMHLSFNN